MEQGQIRLHRKHHRPARSEEAGQNCSDRPNRAESQDRNQKDIQEMAMALEGPLPAPQKSEMEKLTKNCKTDLANRNNRRQTNYNFNAYYNVDVERYLFFPVTRQPPTTPDSCIKLPLLSAYFMSTLTTRRILQTTFLNISLHGGIFCAQKCTFLHLQVMLLMFLVILLWIVGIHFQFLFSPPTLRNSKNTHYDNTSNH